MRRLLIVAAVSALVVAKPELYKEKEDFQYSRSSSDEGSKAGFYGAQRGNMGGNYEKAHNMDGLAQHQMSGLVRQVEGELGDGYKTRTGSVYTAANSRGIYGSGSYDLSNLKGRNFEETEAFKNSLSHSSIMSQNAGFRGQSRLDSAAYGSSSNRAHSSGYRGHVAAVNSEQFMQTDNLQSADNLHSAHEYDYDSQAAQYLNSGFQNHHAYDQSSANIAHSGMYGSNSRSPLLTATPVRVVVRPGGRIAIPLTAQTFDAGHVASSLDQSNVNSEAELLSTSGQRVNYMPLNTPKHYESSYSYRKQWEKHDTQPVAVPLAIPTVNPFPSQKELYDDSQALHLENQHLSNVNAYNSRASNSAYNANIKSSASSKSRYKADFNAQHSSSLSATNSNGFNAVAHTSNAYVDGSAAVADSSNLVELMNTKPKSYHSSYSYHKSWERQGDPYIIKPVGSGIQDGQISQRLTAASLNNGASYSHQYGSKFNQAHQRVSQDGVDYDCDNEGHIRVARSYDTRQEQQFETYQNMAQGQEEFGQQTQDSFNNLEDLGQQTQNNWDDLQNQNHWGNLQDLGQQSENQWGNLQDLSQHKDENLAKLEDLGQQTQTQWSNLQDLGQHTEEKFDKLEDLGQQTQNQWGDLQDLGQHTEEKFNKLEDLGQQTQNQWDHLQDLGQHTEEKFNKLEDLGQQTQNQWGDLQDLGQHTEEKFNKLEDLGQQTQNQWGHLQDLGQHTEEKFDKLEDLGQQTQNQWNKLDLDQQLQTGFDKIHQQTETKWDKLEDLSQQTQSSDLEQQIHPHESEDKKNENKMEAYDNHEQQLQGFWNGFENTNKKNSSSHNLYKNEEKLTPHIWNSNQQRLGDNQQTQNTNFDISKQIHSTQNVWNLIENGNQDQQKQFWGQSEDSKRTITSSVSDSGYKHFNKQNNEQHSDTFWHNHYNNYNDFYLQSETVQNSQTQVKQNSSLGSLWDKLDGIAKETLRHDNDDNVQKIDSGNPTHLIQKQNGNNTHLLRNPQLHNYKPQIEGKPQDSNENPGAFSATTSYHNNNLQPMDIGRGDIGPEDSDPIPAISDISLTNKLYKTPQEIEALSLTKKTNKTLAYVATEKGNDDDIDTLKVLSIAEQNLAKDLKHQLSTTPTSITNSPVSSTNLHQPKNNGITETQLIYQNHGSKLQTNRNTDPAQENIGFESPLEEPLNMNQQFEDFSQLTQELQSQSQPGPFFIDFGQQSQATWLPQDNLEQIQYQQLPHFEEPTQKSEQVQLSYNHEYPISNNRKLSEEIQPMQDTNNESKILIPSESTTEKPGFWGSVSSKLTNAKDKVFSWFKRN